MLIMGIHVWKGRYFIHEKISNIMFKIEGMTVQKLKTENSNIF